eukprot:1177484-Prorocentrum_minimum.AAC.1
MPSRGFLSMARAWRGMSGRDQASGAGERSSVLVSPVTLKTVTVIFSGTSGLDRNHSAGVNFRNITSFYGSSCAINGEGALDTPDKELRLDDVTSFYGSSCAINGKDALHTPEA